MDYSPLYYNSCCSVSTILQILEGVGTTMTNGFTKFCRLALDSFHHDCESPVWKKKGLPTADGAAQNLLRGRKALWKTTTLGALDLKINKWYCWWKKSYTTWCGEYPIVYKVLYIPGDAGFLPSTVGKMVVPLGWYPEYSTPYPPQKSRYSLVVFTGMWLLAIHPWCVCTEMIWNVLTLQGINISHLGKRKIIFKMPFFGGYVSFLEGISLYLTLLISDD